MTLMYCSCDNPIGEDGNEEMMLCGDCYVSFQDNISDYYANVLRDQIREESYLEELS